MINHRQADLADNPTYFISNQRMWHAAGITRIRRHREGWPVEVYHEEGKAEGLDQYQLRDFSGIQRHVALVAVAYSILRAAQQDSDLREKLQGQLKVNLEGSAASWRRVYASAEYMVPEPAHQCRVGPRSTLQHILAPFFRESAAPEPSRRIIGSCLSWHSPVEEVG